MYQKQSILIYPQGTVESSLYLPALKVKVITQYERANLLFQELNRLILSSSWKTQSVATEKQIMLFLSLDICGLRQNVKYNLYYNF